MRILLLILMMTGAVMCCAQSSFNMALPNPYLPGGSGVANSVLEVDDTLYYHGHMVDSDAFTVGFMMKVDQEGNVLDTVIYDGPTASHHVNVPRYDKVIFKEGHLYFNMEEYASSTDISVNIFSLVKTDLNGEIIWKRNIGVDSTGYQQNLYKGVAAHQSGFLAFGFMSDTLGVISFSQVQGLLTRTDSLGIVLWHQRYEGVLEIRHVEVLADDGILISGRQNLAIGGGTGSDIILLRTDSLGNELWRYVYPNPEDGVTDSEGNAPIAIDEEGDIIIVSTDLGHEGFEWTYGPWDIKRIEDHGINGFTVVEDFLRDMADTQKIPFELYQLQNGNFAFMGTNSLYHDETVAPQAGFYHNYGYVQVMSPDLDSLYSRWYAAFNHLIPFNYPREYLYDMAECADGGWALAGLSRSWISDSLPATNHAWILKTDSLGCIEPGCQQVTGLREQIFGLQGSLSLYPNPLQRGDELRVSFNPMPGGEMPYAQDDTRLVIYDQLGRMLHEEELPATGSNMAFNYSISKSSLPSGLYTLHWLSHEGAWYDSQQFVVE